VPATQIQADWAAQRIKSLSLGKAIMNALLPRRNQTEVTSLIEQFQYPKFGPGMMWERCADLVTSRGGTIHLNSAVERVEWTDSTISVHHSTGVVHADHVVSSMPIGQLVAVLDPPAPTHVRRAAAALKHRDFLTVALVVPERHAFPDNWIYIHSPDVRVGRVQNYGSWSPFMVKEGRTCLGLEYFVTDGDDLWTASDDALIELASRELVALELVPDGIVEAGFVVRMPKAYPVYDRDYSDNVTIIRTWLEAAIPNIHPVGRNGMHRYNNQDHSMMTAMLAAENIVSAAGHDVWAVNVDDDYHEESSTGRAAPITG
jgi:protoporphyrinogen oxidase